MIFSLIFLHFCARLVASHTKKGNMMKNRSTALAYAGIISVVLIWGLIPSAKKALIGDSFSASVYSAITAFAAACVLLAMSHKQLKNLNRDYFKVAVPTGVCVGLASLVQALAYNFNASPTNQAFLENLSCVVVPILLFVIVKKRPSILTLAASATCLISSMALAGVFNVGLRFGAADILNALAGLLYGVNIAITGIYAKKYVASLYVMIQLFVQAILSTSMAVAFNFINVGGKPIDPFVFTPNVLLILAIVGIGILSNSVCWTIRTSAMKYVSANVVAVIMPFSAVVTGVFALILGQDEPSLPLLIGAILGLAASFMSSAGDILENKKKEK